MQVSDGVLAKQLTMVVNNTLELIRTQAEAGHAETDMVPTIMAFSTDNRVFLFTCAWPDQATKIGMLRRAGASMRDFGAEPLAAFLRTEIWTLPAEIVAGLKGIPRQLWPQPMNHPQCIEKVAVIGLSADNRGIVLYFEMKRNEAHQIVELVPEDSDREWRSLVTGDRHLLTDFYAGYMGPVVVQA
jgi:hypothetical protein